MLSDKIINQYNNLSSIIANYNCKVEGNFYCKESANNVIVDRTKEKIHNLSHLVLEKKNICEIGFNAGHSLLIMLNENPKAHYTIFDINHHPYTEECFVYVRSQYPNTSIDICYGDSVVEVPKYYNQNKINFDFIHIDGGHGAREVKGDYENCLSILSKDGIILFDDTHIKRIKKFLNQKFKSKEIEELSDGNLQITNLHVAFRIGKLYDK